jgi:iron(III) transport system permease protein
MESHDHRRALIERWFNQTKTTLMTPQVVISGILMIVLTYLIVVPLIQMTWRTLTWGEGDRRFSREAVTGEVTGFHWTQAVSGPTSEAFLYEPLVNTMITGTLAAVFALTLGAGLAWLVTRTDMPGKGWLRPTLILPYIVPSFALALAWETLFKSPKTGGQPGLFQFLFDVAPPTWLSFGAVPIIITMSIHYFPFAFLMVSGALATVDSQLEECAELTGASRWTVLRKITFPIVAPAILGAAVLTFGKTIGTFALPYLLGRPVEYQTLATMLFSSVSLGFTALGYILSLVLIIITVIVIWVSARILGGNLRRFETIGGKGFKANLTQLGPWRWPLFGMVCFIAFIAAIFPIALLGYQTLMMVDGNYGFDNLTLHYWLGKSNPDIARGEPGVLHNTVILGATWNTLRLAFLASIVSSLVGLIIGYIVVRGRAGLVSKTLDQISFLPFLIPGIAFAAMYLGMFAVQRGPIPALYGTFALLVLICVVNRLPYSTRTGAAAVTQIGQELEEAAELQGASWVRRFWRVILPLSTGGVVAGMLVSFIGIMRELSLIILLITPSTRVLMTVGFRYAEEDQTQLTNALVMVVTVLTLLGQALVWQLGKGRLRRLKDRQID